MKLDKTQKLIWDASRKAILPLTPDKNNAWNSLIQCIERQEKKQNANEEVTTFFSLLENLRAKFQVNYNYSIALALALFLAIPITYNFYQKETLQTNTGERLSFLLPDNSKIILNSESKITYEKNFNSDHRIINLKGEAYFEVEKNSLPFIVRTDYGNITVLGTAFNISTRDNEFEVGVTKGIVKVSNENSYVKLGAKQCLISKDSFNIKNVLEIPYKKYPDWINDKLFCNKMPLEKVCMEIERIFNVTIIFSDLDLKDITITGIIDTSDLKTMLNTVSLLTQHKFKLEDGTYTII